MSFSVETKNELARLNTVKKCCMLAEIAGFIRFCGSVRLAGLGKISLVMSTENLAVIRHYKTLIKEYFNLDTKVFNGEENCLKKTSSYELHIDSEHGSEQILREVGILMVREGSNYFSDGIYDELIRTKCCRKSYLRGAFLASGTITEPDKGYHFEILCNTEKIATDMAKLLKTFTGITPKTVKRKKKVGVYIKQSEQIGDILRIMGVSGQVLQFEEVRLVKQLTNDTNRLSNCDTANVKKTVMAAEKQVYAIKKLIEKDVLYTLDNKLISAAEARLANPSANLEEIGNLMKPPLKKSGVNHRLKKLEKIAEEI